MTQNHKNNHLVTYFIGAILGLGLGINGILRDQSAELTTFTIVTCIAGAACLVRSAYLYGRLTESQASSSGIQPANQSNVL